MIDDLSIDGHIGSSIRRIIIVSSDYLRIRPDTAPGAQSIDDPMTQW
jgi:hypothetical protein